MKKKFFMSAALMLLLGGATTGVNAATVHTSCSKTVKLKNKEYKSAQEMVDAALAIDKALCK